MPQSGRAPWALWEQPDRRPATQAWAGQRDGKPPPWGPSSPAHVTSQGSATASLHHGGQAAPAT